MEYFDPSREELPHSLPDLEVFQVPDDYTLEADEEGNPYAPGWYYWACFPGCIPDSDPCGPFETEAAALADARESAGYEEDEGE